MRSVLLLAMLILPCGAADEVPDLSHIREVNLDRAAKLPDFVADETTVRYTKKKGQTEWQIMDRIQAEIAVQAKGEFVRRNVRLNGQPWDKPFPGWNWGVPFGEELTELFDPKCKTGIEFDGRTEWEGKPVLAYRFHAAANGCFGYWATKGLLSTKRYNPARRGRFLVDIPNNNVIRFEIEAIDFPKSFGNDTWTEASSWSYLRIGDETFLLPVAFETVIGSSTGELLRAMVAYTNHRHFEASTSVKFK